MPSGMGYGAAQGLQQVLANLYLRTQQRRQQELDALTQARQQRVDADQQQRWQSDFELRKAAADRLLALDKSKADAEAAERAERQRVLDSVVNNPTTPVAARNLLLLGQHGLGANLNVHNLEAPGEHAAETAAANTAEDNRKYEAWKRQQDYTEQLRRNRPAVAGRLVQDDPTFPVGVQTHIAQIRTRHPDFESALGELVNSFGSHQQAHPNFQPQKAVAALRQMYSGSGQPGRTANPFVQQAVEAAMGGGGGRAGGSGRPATMPQTGGGIRPGGPSAGPAQVITGEQLTALAQKHGLTLEQARAKAQSLGYTVQ